MILLLVVSLTISMTKATVTYAEEKGEEPITEYYGPRDGIEVEELRTETAKQYLLPDGTMQYIQCYTIVQILTPILLIIIWIHIMF